ncbi:multidrug resistance-associated protein 1-like isoform X4 [Varroa destructor]|uniref:Uncharacterized protein n=1 Tax=Varroa destructor TaxID=109461 RepID=A0A7M7J8Q8_VARDE|nr:multidrug resistance-associated protein 1-like isoform X4 [Varroa destructor]
MDNKTSRSSSATLTVDQNRSYLPGDSASSNTSDGQTKFSLPDTPRSYLFGSISSDKNELSSEKPSGTLRGAEAASESESTPSIRAKQSKVRAPKGKDNSSESEDKRGASKADQTKSTLGKKKGKMKKSKAQTQSERMKSSYRERQLKSPPAKLELDHEFPEEARTLLTNEQANIIQYTAFANFDKSLKKKGTGTISSAPLWKELLWAFHTFIFQILLIQVGLVITYTGPIYFVRNLIRSLMGPSPIPAAYYWSFGVFAISLLYSIFVNHLFYRMFSGGLQQRAALLTSLYHKVCCFFQANSLHMCLTIHRDARKRFSPGDILNFASVDILQLFQYTQLCGQMIGIPTRMLIGFFISYDMLGPGVIGIFTAVIVLFPLSIYIVIKLDSINRACMLEKDKRLNIVSEVMEGIKIIKLFGWEIAFSKKISDFRDSESGILKSFIMLELVANVVWNSSPFLIVIATFGILLFWDGDYPLTPDVTFAMLMLIGTLRAYLTQLPIVISRLVQARTAVKRMETFLHCEDMVETVDRELEDDSLVIDIRKATFSWGQVIALKDINLQVKHGELIAVLGQVGAGKTSLIQALLDEMNIRSGKIAVRKVKKAYVPQEAWLQEGSIRQNILFKYRLDKRRYSKVITKCCLETDLKLFAQGDASEVGERGMLLSGGQKQRVSIARAVYSQSDLNLFDDPLSALDSAVAEKIFRGVISNSGMLKGTTRILATHNTGFLPFCDRIVVLDAGRIAHMGTFEELKNKLDLRRVCRTGEATDLTDLQSTRVLSFLQLAAADAKAEINSDKRLRAEEAASATGISGWSTYLKLVKYIGIITVVIFLIGYAAYRGFDIGSNVWVRKWVTNIYEMSRNSTLSDPEKEEAYHAIMTEGLEIYIALGGASTFSVFIGFLFLSLGCHKAAFNMHKDMLSAVMRAPLNFFDTTPVGRIINRFSNDVTVMDLEIHRALDDFIAFLFAIIGCALLVTYQLPVMVFFVIPGAMAFMYVRKIFLEAARKSRRLALISLSPVLNAFSEALYGVSVIRAFEAEEMLLERNHLRINVSQNTFLHSLITIRWATVRIDLINALVVLAMCMLLVYNHEDLGPARVGLLVSYVMTVTRFMSRFVESCTILEGSIVSAERLIEYSKIAPEASWTKGLMVLPAVWPSAGLVEFKNYSSRYGDSKNLCLKNLNLKIPPGHKVGVVGRTGAGKSSLTLALFRIIEPASGQILIDGIDTSKLALHDLRKRLTIIPQDPILFEGTLRSNLDPDGVFSDESIERAARSAHLRHDLSLDTVITEGGSNLSLGERQLVCLGRALLRKSKLLVLDEATAAVDLHTDLLIQTTIREVFSNSTIITVAHRLLTILDYDMVVVMSAGEIIEKGRPLALIEDVNTQFYKMARDARLVPED